MGFQNLTFTDEGKALQIKTLYGDSITFTKVEIGDGKPTVNINELKQLNNMLYECDITRFENKGDYAIVHWTLDTKYVTNDFYWTEYGIFAKDSSNNEVLYAYAYDDNPQLIPSGNSPSITQIETDINIALGDAENVNAIIGNYSDFVTKEEAETTYLSKEDATTNYETKEEAVGKSLSGQEVSVTSTYTVTGAEGAEIVNDYRTREFEDKTIRNQSISWADKGNIASGKYAFAQGKATTASAFAAFSTGEETAAYGYASAAFGNQTDASGNYSSAFGSETLANGKCANASGYKTIAYGDYSFSIGSNTTAKGYTSFTSGCNTIANNYQTVIGYNNAEKAGRPTLNDGNDTGEYSLFIVGYGETSDARANAFRIDCGGSCYGYGAFNSSGADYAEYFEWLDGNADEEDRRGLFVTLNGEKIKLANSGDEIIGVISSNPSAVGDAKSEEWKDRYLRDVFGNVIRETIEVAETIDEETGDVIPAHCELRKKLNPNYDATKEYVSREFRREWAIVGLLGKLIVCDDGTSEVGGYCTASNKGIATKSENGYRVLARIDGNHIKILYR